MIHGPLASLSPVVVATRIFNPLLYQRRHLVVEMLEHALLRTRYEMGLAHDRRLPRRRCVSDLALRA